MNNIKHPPSDQHSKRFISGGYDSEINFYKKILSQYDKPVVFDVGANVGYITVALSDISHEIHTFEPVEYLYEYLLLNTSMFNNIHNNKLAIHNRCLKDKIKISKNHHQGHSLDSRIHEKFNNIFSNEYQDIECITLSSYIESNRINHVSLIKLDCEGLEEIAINSLDKYIDLVDNIVFESYFMRDVEKLISTYPKFRIIRTDIKTGGPLYHMYKE